jgi:hypothetical protein
MAHKAGVTIGMAMTEKQGGTDVRANTTKAYPVGASGPGQAYELVGHKWFCSAPMCDAFLTLAQTDKGLTCFLLPRHRPDDTRNQFYIQRLKNKLGNCSNASSEVEFRGALAWMVGEEGRGVPTIIEMVAMTRFDCMVGSSSLMRQALTQASHHCAHRSVGGKLLSEQPLMQNVLADLALESEAALALSLRMGRALDHLDDAGSEIRPAGDGGGQVLDLQTRAGHDQRSRRMHGRRRVCRRQHPAAAVPRGTGQLDVGRLRQRAMPRRAAGAVERAGRAGCAVQRAGRRPWRQAPGRAYQSVAGAVQGHQRHSVPCPATDRRHCPGLQAKLLLEAGNAAVSDAFIASRLNGGGGSMARCRGAGCRSHRRPLNPAGFLTPINLLWERLAAMATFHSTECGIAGQLPQDSLCVKDLGTATVPVKPRCRQDEACKSEHRKLIVTEAFIVVQTAEQAVDRLALHKRATTALNSGAQALPQGSRRADAEQRALFRYPELRLTYLCQGEVPQTTRAYAKVQLPAPTASPSPTLRRSANTCWNNWCR